MTNEGGAYPASPLSFCISHHQGEGPRTNWQFSAPKLHIKKYSLEKMFELPR